MYLRITDDSSLSHPPAMEDEGSSAPQEREANSSPVEREEVASHANEEEVNGLYHASLLSALR